MAAPSSVQNALSEFGIEDKMGCRVADMPLVYTSSEGTRLKRIIREHPVGRSPRRSRFPCFPLLFQRVFPSLQRKPRLSLAAASPPWPLTAAMSRRTSPTTAQILGGWTVPAKSSSNLPACGTTHRAYKLLAPMIPGYSYPREGLRPPRMPR